jgi:hypothetical protein
MVMVHRFRIQRQGNPYAIRVISSLTWRHQMYTLPRALEVNAGN